jgi:hypothetical protein
MLGNEVVKGYIDLADGDVSLSNDSLFNRGCRSGGVASDLNQNAHEERN